MSVIDDYKVLPHMPCGCTLCDSWFRERLYRAGIGALVTNIPKPKYGNGASVWEPHRPRTWGDVLTRFDDIAMYLGAPDPSWGGWCDGAVVILMLTGPKTGQVKLTLPQWLDLV